MTTDAKELVSHVRQALGVACLPGHKICVALSGGMDSMVLLHVLTQVRALVPITLSALHVNHGISPNAAAWAEFCRQVCRDLDVPCEVATLPALDSAGGGLERAAREARYAVFSGVDADVLCMAHHQNDRAETLLLNLFRGAGPQGLAAMPGTRFLNGKRLIRPFIDLPRDDLHAWAIAHEVRWIEDESNQNLHFRRNYMRHVVLPAITEQFPGVVGVLARTAAQMQDQTRLLARLADIDAKACQDETGHLAASLLATQPAEVVQNVLKHRLNAAGVHIPAASRLAALSSQLRTVQPGSEIFVRMGQVGIHVWRDRLWVDPAMRLGCPDAQPLQTGRMQWPDGQLEVSASEENFVVAPVGQGQRFQPRGRCRDTVTELLRARGIPPWIRPRLPALRRGGELAWVAGLGWGQDYPDGNGRAHPDINWLRHADIWL